MYIAQVFINISYSCSVVQKNLTEGEVIVVDAGCVVAMTRLVDMQVKYTGSVRRTLLGVCLNLFLTMKYLIFRAEL